MDTFCQAPEYRATDFGAPKLWKGRSGYSEHNKQDLQLYMPETEARRRESRVDDNDIRSQNIETKLMKDGK